MPLIRYAVHASVHILEHRDPVIQWEIYTLSCTRLCSYTRTQRSCHTMRNLYDLLRYNFIYYWVMDESRNVPKCTLYSPFSFSLPRMKKDGGKQISESTFRYVLLFICIMMPPSECWGSYKKSTEPFLKKNYIQSFQCNHMIHPYSIP